MKTIHAGHRLINEPSPTKKIEQIARICYKSEDKICDGSDFKMIKSLVQRKHLAMLEHADVCIEVNEKTYCFMNTICKMLMEDTYDGKEPYRCYLRFSRYFPEVGEDGDFMPKRFLISGNMRAWLETFDMLDAAKALIPELCQVVVDAAGGSTGVLYQYDGYQQPVDEVHMLLYKFDENDVKAEVVTDFSKLSYEERMLHDTFTIMFCCDRGITHELVRMREHSFAQESTRYCNYSFDKHSNQISVIAPFFFEEGTEAYKVWKQAMEAAEYAYLRLTEDLKIPAQQARTVLPHSTKVDIAMTANLREWRHTFELRACDSTGPAHPQIAEIMRPCLRDMREIYRFAFGDLCTPDEINF